MSPVAALAICAAAGCMAYVAAYVATLGAYATLRALRALRHPAAPPTPTTAILRLCGALEPNAWRSVVITQQPGSLQVSGDGQGDMVPLLAAALLAAIEQRDRAANAVRERMAQAGQGQWVSSDEVVF